LLAAGTCTALIAFFTDLQVLLNLVSIGTLFVFYMVANALIYRRHVVVGKTSPVPTLAYLTALTALATCFVILWQSMMPGGGDDDDHHQLLQSPITRSSSSSSCSRAYFLLAACAGLSILITGVFWWKVPSVHKGKEWTVPCMPWIAAASISLNVFLLGSVDRDSYVRFAIWTSLAIALYFFYGVHSTHDAMVRGLDLIELTKPAGYHGRCSMISVVVPMIQVSEDTNRTGLKNPSAAKSLTELPVIYNRIPDPKLSPNTAALTDQLKQLQADEADEYWIEVKPDPRKK
jgi:hypothetical protein